MTTSAPTVEVARSPMLDLREQEELRLNACFLHSPFITFSQHSRVLVSPIALAAAAAGLQESARIATGLSTASAPS